MLETSEPSTYSGDVTLDQYNNENHSSLVESMSSTEVISSSTLLSTNNGLTGSNSPQSNRNEAAVSRNRSINSQDEITTSLAVERIESSSQISLNSNVTSTAFLSSEHSSIYSGPESPNFANVSETSVIHSIVENTAPATSLELSEILPNSIEPTSVTNESLTRLSGLTGGDGMTSVEIGNEITTVTSFRSTTRNLPVSVVVTPFSSSMAPTVITVITTTMVEAAGCYFGGVVPISGLPDDSENAPRVTITTTITSTLCSECVEMAVGSQQGNIAPSQEILAVPNNPDVGAPINNAGPNLQQSISQTSRPENLSTVLATFSASPNGQTQFNVNLSVIMISIFSVILVL